MTDSPEKKIDTTPVEGEAGDCVPADVLGAMTVAPQEASVLAGRVLGALRALKDDADSHSRMLGLTE